MLRLALAFALALSSAAAVPAFAQDKAPTTKEFKMKIADLPPAVRKAIGKALKEKGIKVADGMMLYASTADCPSFCNNSIGGGFCYCEPDSNGDCPDGTSKTGTPEKPECKVRIPSGTVSGGGLTEPLEVLMP